MKSITLISGDLQKEIGYKNRARIVCSAMRKCMNNGDIILYQPLKGNGTTLVK